ncbi:MAG: hypothetical protein H7329_01680 [Opitutaceae bacterium]|nr:hypothetical protein [Cytophagales bacterium]
MQTFFVLAEAGRSYGMGHVVRLFALCELLGIEKQVKVCIKTDWTAEEASAIDFLFHQIELVKDDHAAIDKIPPGSIVLMDGYHFSIEKINEAKKQKQWKIVFVADVQQHVPNCDLLINHLPWIKETDYPDAIIEKKLVGPSFAILRKPFYSKKKILSENRILVCLGGSGVENILLHIYSALIANGIAADKIDVLYNRPINGIPEHSIHFNLGAEQVYKLIAKAGVCFITPGNISYEVFSIGRNAVMGTVTENQVPVARKFNDLNLAFNIGSWATANFENLQLWIDEASNTSNCQKLFFKKMDKQNIQDHFINLTN